MNIALFIDRLILGLHQDVSDKLQTVLGINNFHLAWWMVLHFVGCVLALLTIGFVSPITDPILILLMVADIKKGQKSIKLTTSGVGTRNVLEISSSARWARLLWVGTLVVFIAVIPIPGIVSNHEVTLLGVLKLTMFTSSRYFAACTPKPPSKSDLRKLVEVIGRGLKRLVPKPVEPIPVPA